MIKLKLHSLSDTDSLLIAIAGPSLRSIVKDGMLEEWIESIEPAWFVKKDSDGKLNPESSKTPGLLKPEFEATRGLFWLVNFYLKLKNYL